MRRSFFSIAAVAVVIGTSCVPEVTIGDARILCVEGDACPGGLECDVAAGLCVPEGATLDRAAPFLEDATASAPVVGPEGTVTITLVASEALASAPVVTRARTVGDDVEDLPLPVEAAPAGAETTWLAVLESDDEDVSGAVSLTVTLVDKSANATTVRVPVEVAFDLDAPLPVFARADVDADAATNALFPGAPRSIRADSALVIEVAFDEPIDAASITVIDDAGNTIDTVDAGDDLLAAGARFRLGFGVFAAAVDGPVVITLVATDAHGNTFEGPIEALLTPLLTIDNVPPPAPVLEVLARRPWGSIVPAATTIGAGTAEDALIVLVLPGDVDVIDGEVPPTVARAGASGGTFSFEIPVDVPGLAVVAVDDAGNLSEPARPLLARVTAGIVDTASPHRVSARPVARAALVQQGDRPVDIDLRAGESIVDAAPFWRPLTPVVSDLLPFVPVLAPDPISGSMLAVANGRTFLIDGAQVKRLDIPELPLRDGVAMSFDPLRGVVVLFGGNGLGDDATNSLYEWDGVRWIERVAHDPAAVGRPSPRLGHTVVDVPALGGVLIVNGCPARSFGQLAGCLGAVVPDVWLWDGDTFTELCSGAACGDAPPPLAPAIGVDVDGRIVAVSGHTVPPVPLAPGTPLVAVFEDGTWTRECSDACAEDSPADAVAFERDGELFVYGLVDGGPRLQTYDASGFTAVPLLVRSGTFPGSPFQVPPIAMRGDGAIVIAGNAFSTNGQSVILVDKGRQDALVPSPFQARCGGAAVDTSFGVVLAAGCDACDVVPDDLAIDCTGAGALDGVQVIDGAAIVDVSVTGPAPSGPAFGIAIGARIVVVTRDALSGDVALTSSAGLTWTAGSTIPAGGLNLVPSALVADPETAGRSLLFFGDASAGTATTLDRIDAVDADGIATALCSSGCGTGALAAGGWSATSGRGSFATFTGGWASVVALDPPAGDGLDTSILDAQPLREVSSPAGAALPPKRANAGFAFDATREVAWLFGGTTKLAQATGNDTFECRVGGPAECDDVWAFDGTTWTEVVPVDVLGTGRPRGRAAPQMSFDGGVVVAGGQAFRAIDDVWRLETSTLLAPAHVFEAQLEPMGEDAATSPTQVEVIWCGNALDAGGGDVEVDISLWTPAGFAELAVENIPGQPTCRFASAPATMALTFVPRGPERSVFVQVKPGTTTPAANVAAGFARLVTTALEVLVGFAP